MNEICYGCEVNGPPFPLAAVVARSVVSGAVGNAKGEYSDVQCVVNYAVVTLKACIVMYSDI